MSNWDFCYSKSGAPVANDNAPTVDGGANDPRTFTGSNGPFVVTDKYGIEQSPQLVIFSVGGTATVNVYVYSKAANSWLIAGTCAPSATGPAKVSVPPHSLVFIQVVANGGATSIYAGQAGISGEGLGATFSSADLSASVTDETGTGALVFANTPTLITPNIGAATGTSLALGANPAASGWVRVPYSAAYTGIVSIKDSGGTTREVISVTGSTFQTRFGWNGYDSFLVGSSVVMMPGGTALVTFGPSTNTFSNPIALGLNPSSTGGIRLQNALSIDARNAANNGNITLVGSDASNNVVMGAGATQVIVSAPFQVSGSVRSNLTAAAGSVDGLIATSSSAATVGGPVMNSPRLRFRGAAYNSVSALGEFHDFLGELVAVTAAGPTTAYLRFGYAFNLNSTFTDVLRLPSSGGLSLPTVSDANIATPPAGWVTLYFNGTTPRKIDSTGTKSDL